MLKINFSDNVYQVEITPDTMLSELAARVGIMLDLRCAGFGVCGRCRVELLSGTFIMDGKKTLVDAPVSAPACRTQALGGKAEIFVPAISVVHTDGQIAVDYEHIRKPLRSNVAKKGLAVAIDVGTTTVAMVLMDLERDEPLASVSAYNRQSACGDNVSSRISCAMAAPEKLQHLRHLIVRETINPLLRRLFAETHKNLQEVSKVSVAGNTVMAHLFIGASPESIGVLPFRPMYREFPAMTAKEAGLDVNPEAIVSLIPAISGYIGGDVTAGIIASGIDQNHQRSLLIDVGTNCEIVLCDGQNLYACAAAAGPAFEGAGIACGSRAAAGAIDHVWITEDLQLNYSTIEDAAPAGLCGSAIIDFLAEGFRCGLIDSFGRYNLDMLRIFGRYHEVDYGHGVIHGCVIAISSHGKPVYVSEADIEQVLKAKAAVYAGIKALLEQCHMKFNDLETVYLAGGFARYLHIENAVELGMLPPLKPDIYRKIGNSSLAGAVMDSIDPDFAKLATDIIDIPHIIELNILPEFENHYIDALMIPHFNPGEFEAS